MSDIILVDVMQLEATVEQARAFVLDPERVADYYPDIYEYGTFIEGEAIWCYGKTGVALLEYPVEERTDQRIVMKVTTNTKLKPPFSIESMAAIKADPFVTLVEDWDFEANGNGVEITKTWRDVKKHKLKWLPLPLKYIVRKTGKQERSDLIDGWNKAARENG